MKKLKKSVPLWTAAGIFLLTGCFNAGGSEISLIQPAGEAEGMEENAPVQQAEEGIYIHICGAVRMPGVYAMEPKSRYVDAVNAAGGLTEDACADAVNLAETVEDGVQIYIPFLQEERTGAPDTIGINGAGDLKAVNINRAGSEELCTLSGIGESRAGEIIRYREANGGFEKIEDIMKVTGIKQGLFEKIKDHICIR